jgi:hypothetical protein
MMPWQELDLVDFKAGLVPMPYWLERELNPCPCNGVCEYEVHITAFGDRERVTTCARPQ